MQRHAKKNAQTAHLHAMQTKAKHRAASAMQKKQLPSPSYAEKKQALTVGSNSRPQR
jgi:hypothetical protein